MTTATCPASDDETFVMPSPRECHSSPGRNPGWPATGGNPPWPNCASCWSRTSTSWWTCCACIWRTRATGSTPPSTASAAWKCALADPPDAGGARHHAARLERIGSAAPPACHKRSEPAGPDAHRPRRGTGQGAGAGIGRRRLPDQTLLHPRVDCPGSGPAAKGPRSRNPRHDGSGRGAGVCRVVHPARQTPCEPGGPAAWS
jgi:hypothetical protein